MSVRWERLYMLLGAGMLATAETGAAERVMISHPAPHEVVQRDRTAPGEGQADLLISGSAPDGTAGCTWSCRVAPALAGATNNVAWQAVTLDRDGAAFQTTLRVPAGGWYRLELRGEENGAVRCEGTVEPFGVGEVFVIAGQSYATNTNEQRHNVQDRQRRVVAYDSADQKWRVAFDPQPTPDGSDGGSIWPPLGDSLAEQLQVPIGFANVAWGGTASRQWMPAEPLHTRLVETGKQLGRFRAVLWQQGESDVIEKTPTDKYVANLVELRAAAAQAWGFEPCWLPAKSTHHPTVYNDPEGENRIRSAIDVLVTKPGFCTGPDTDTLQGENRGDAQSRRHFSAVGQVRAAALWQNAITLLLTKADKAP